MIPRIVWRLLAGRWSSLSHRNFQTEGIRLTTMQIATVGKSLENVSFTARRELLRHEPTDLSRAQDCVRVCATISRRTLRLVGRAQRLEAATPRRHAVELTSCMGHRLRRSNACVAAVLAILNRFDLEGVDPCRDGGVPATQDQNQALRLPGILFQDRDVSVEQLRYLVVRIRSNWRASARALSQKGIRLWRR